VEKPHGVADIRINTGRIVVMFSRGFLPLIFSHSPPGIILQNYSPVNIDSTPVGKNLMYFEVISLGLCHRCFYVPEYWVIKIIYIFKKNDTIILFLAF